MQLTWLLDDNGIPADWRSLEGFGVNTYTLVDAKGKETLVKFHWKPKGGPKFLTDDEASGRPPCSSHAVTSHPSFPLCLVWAGPNIRSGFAVILA